MTSFPRGIRHFLGAMYAWAVAVFFGAVLVDVVYANLLRGVSAVIVQPVHREVSDFLLILGAFSFVAALAAIVVSVGIRPATYLFAASLLMLSSEFLAPTLLFPLLRVSPEVTARAIALCARLLPVALASLLALAALRASFRERRSLGRS